MFRYERIRKDQNENEQIQNSKGFQQIKSEGENDNSEMLEIEPGKRQVRWLKGGRLIKSFTFSSSIWSCSFVRLNDSRRYICILYGITHRNLRFYDVEEGELFEVTSPETLLSVLHPTKLGLVLVSVSHSLFWIGHPLETLHLLLPGHFFVQSSSFPTIDSHYSNNSNN